MAGIRYTYLVELRDAGVRGFQLPVDEIVPTGIENWAGLRELAAHVLLEHGRRRRPTAAASIFSTHSRRRTPCRTSSSAALRCRRRHPHLLLLVVIAAAALLTDFLQRPCRLTDAFL